MRTFWEFDDRVTAPLNGYLNVDDYYRRASSRYFLGAIETPTLIIQSEDDPFVFKHSIPEASELSPAPNWSCTPRAAMWVSWKARREHPGTTLSAAFRSGWPASSLSLRNERASKVSRSVSGKQPR
jgi:hypothetical protein